jgi:DNA-binding NarL/FixJ family response regulator
MLQDDLVAEPTVVQDSQLIALARQQLDRLTEREREVAVAIRRGKSAAEISRDLYMSIATVKAHVSRPRSSN